jgi:hypothetical protein
MMLRDDARQLTGAPYSRGEHLLDRTDAGGQTEPLE